MEIGGEVVTRQTTSSVEVVCIPGFDGGLPQSFMLELYTSTSAVPRFNITAPEPRFLLTDLEPDVTFRIVVFAVNAKGRSQGVSTEEVLFSDAEKRTAHDSDISISPLLGVIAGVVFTLIVIVLMVLIRMRRAQESADDEPKSVQDQPGGIAKSFHRNISPREYDERDPDIIPAKYGSPEPDKLRFGINQNVPPDENTTQWINPGPAPIIEPLFHQYSSPVGLLSSYPRDLRPSDLHIENDMPAMSAVTRSSDLELNGLAIKERLMANRLPESCV